MNRKNKEVKMSYEERLNRIREHLGEGEYTGPQIIVVESSEEAEKIEEELVEKYGEHGLPKLIFLITHKK